MAENGERKKFWNIFYSPLVLIILLVVFVFIIRSTWNVYEHEKVSETDHERVENELNTINQRSATLKTQVETLETTQGVDDEIRSKFNVTKPGEGVAVIVNIVSTTSATSTGEEGKSWWQKFMGIFGQ